MTSGQSLALLVIGVAASSLLCVAADKKQLSTTVAAVEANLKTEKGKRYDSEFGKELYQKYGTTLRQCKEDAASAGKPADFRHVSEVEGKRKGRRDPDICRNADRAVRSNGTVTEAIHSTSA